MRLEHRVSTAFGCACVVVATLASVGSAGSLTAAKQRIAIIQRTNFAGSGTFELVPVSPGPLKRDSGTVSGSGTHDAPVVRGGLRVTPFSGAFELKGKRGTLRISEVLESTEVADGYGHDTGTWSINIYATTGVYKGYAGEGRSVGVSRASDRRVVFRSEGFVTKG